MEQWTVTAESRYGLPARVWENLGEAFKAGRGLEAVILFGSRARGDHRAASDIDLDLVGDDLSRTDQFRLETALDDLLLPWTIDLCYYHAISEPALKEEIDRWGVVVWQKEVAGPLDGRSLD